MANPLKNCVVPTLCPSNICVSPRGPSRVHVHCYIVAAGPIVHPQLHEHLAQTVATHDLSFLDGAAPIGLRSRAFEMYEVNALPKTLAQDASEACIDSQASLKQVPHDRVLMLLLPRCAV